MFYQINKAVFSIIIFLLMAGCMATGQNNFDNDAGTPQNGDSMEFNEIGALIMQLPSQAKAEKRNSITKLGDYAQSASDEQIMVSLDVISRELVSDFDLIQVASTALDKLQNEAERRNLNPGEPDDTEGDGTEGDDEANESNGDTSGTGSDSGDTSDISGSFYGVVVNCVSAASPVSFANHPESLTITCSSIFSDSSYSEVQQKNSEFSQNCKRVLGSDTSALGDVQYVINGGPSTVVSSNRNDAVERKNEGPCRVTPGNIYGGWRLR